MILSSFVSHKFLCNLELGNTTCIKTNNIYTIVVNQIGFFGTHYWHKIYDDITNIKCFTTNKIESRISSWYTANRTSQNEQKYLSITSKSITATAAPQAVAAKVKEVRPVNHTQLNQRKYTTVPSST